MSCGFDLMPITISIDTKRHLDTHSIHQYGIIFFLLEAVEERNWCTASLGRMANSFHYELTKASRNPRLGLISVVSAYVFVNPNQEI